MDYSKLKDECERIKKEIELAEAEKNLVKVFELSQELEFLMRNFPTECSDGEPIDESTKEGKA